MMEVTIQSTLPTVGGSATIAVEPDYTIHSLVVAFCQDKNVPPSSEYVIRNREQQVLDSSKTLADCGISKGEKLFISLRDVPETGFCCRGCNQWWTLAVVLLLIGVVGITTVSLLRVKSRAQPQDYGVVLDAGSSHTQIYVYKWPADKENGTGLAEQKYTERAEGGGISNYTEDPPKAGKSLEPILDSALKHVPSESQSVTPIFLGATAGMRLLEASDNITAQEILSSVRSTFEKYPFLYNNSQKQVRILDGIEEGTFSWVTANFLSGAFNQYSIAWNHLLGHIPTYTHGALDLGGASTQNTFIPQDIVSPDYAESVRIYDTDYTVYSHSYLCYGLNEAFRQLTAHIVLNATYDNPNITTVTNPCQPLGYNESWHYKDVFEAPCSNTIAPNSTSKNTTFVFVGSSDTQECANVTRLLFDFDNEDCAVPPCSFNNVHQPTVFGSFYAFSGYWNTMYFLNTTDTTLAEFESARDAFCAKNWTSMSGFPASPVYLVRYCFNAHFIHSLLIDGYNFSSETWKSIHFKKSINNSDLGWSLGFMLNATNRYPARYPQSYITLTMAVLLIILFVIFLAVALAFAWHAWQRHRASKKPYEKLNSYGAI